MAFRRAFTMAELMVCILIASVAILGLVSVLSYSIRARGKSSQRHTASLIATSLANDAELACWKDFSQPLARPRAPVPGYPEFEALVSEQMEDPPDNTLKRLEVRVFWTDKQGKQEYVLWTKFTTEN
ncbi:MAG: hypothetical protein AB1758_07365 [Candidatus Eremiobacterota bacterium]